MASLPLSNGACHGASPSVLAEDPPTRHHSLRALRGLAPCHPFSLLLKVRLPSRVAGKTKLSLVALAIPDILSK
jgi:hypothetical protein